MTYLRREDPSFSLSGFGFQSTRAFLKTLDYAVAHDGFDVVINLQSEIDKPPSEIEEPVPTVSTGVSPSEARALRATRIHPALWRAATRTSSMPLYLDLRGLEEGEVRIVPESGVDGDQGRFRAIPASDADRDASWVSEWLVSRAPTDELAQTLMDGAHSAEPTRVFEAYRDAGRGREYLLARVGATKRHLLAWVKSNDLEWGPPLVEAAIARALTSTTTLSRPSGPPDLREIVLRAVERLSNEELRQLRLPVGVVLEVVGEGR